MSYVVEIEFTDGTRQTVASVTDASTKDGVLTLSYRWWMDGIGYREQVLGHFPLVNVRRWVPRDA